MNRWSWSLVILFFLPPQSSFFFPQTLLCLLPSSIDLPSCALYEEWGAFGKVDQMRNEYEFLSSSSTLSNSSSRSSHHQQTSLKGVSRYEKHLSDSLKTYSISGGEEMSS